MQSIYAISSIIVTFLKCPACPRHCTECFRFTMAFNAVPTLGGLSPRWQWWSQHLLEKLRPESRVLPPVRIACPSRFGVIPSPASWDSLRNGPEQLIDERTVQSLLIMLIITWGSGLSVITEESFSGPNTREHCVSFGQQVWFFNIKNNWVCFPLYISC